MKRILGAAALAVTLATAPSPALAIYAIHVVEAGLTCYDNDACDSIGAANVMSVSTGVSGFLININTSFTNSPGGPVRSILDLNWTLSTSETGGGTIHILASATGFTFPQTGSLPYLNSSIGGTGAGTFSVTGYEWVDLSNTLFGTGGISSTLGPFSNNPFSASESVQFLSSTPYSITEQLTVTLGADSSTTGDLQAVVVPQPSTLLLLGAGLFGFAWFVKRRRRPASV